MDTVRSLFGESYDFEKLRNDQRFQQFASKTAQIQAVGRQNGYGAGDVLLIINHGYQRKRGLVWDTIPFSWLDDVRDYIYQYTSAYPKHGPNAGCATSEQQELFIRIVGLVMKKHAQGTVPRTADGITDPLSIDEWIRAGRPTTWSPLIDMLLAGYETAYRDDNTLTRYLRSFWALLKNGELEKNTNQPHKEECANVGT